MQVKYLSEPETHRTGSRKPSAEMGMERTQWRETRPTGLVLQPFITIC
jgi:hypothetical protein